MDVRLRLFFFQLAPSVLLPSKVPKGPTCSPGFPIFPRCVPIQEPQAEDVACIMSVERSRLSVSGRPWDSSKCYGRNTPSITVLSRLLSMPDIYWVKLDSKQLPLWLRFRVWLGSWVYKSRGETHSPQVVRIPPRQLVKFRCHRSELGAMQFARQHTTIPIPRITEVYDDGDCQHLVMEYVAGEPLEVVWRAMTAERRQNIVKQLTSYVNQLRNLVPQVPGLVGSTTLSSGYDHRLGGNRFGPFQNIADFHTFVRRGTPVDAWNETVSRVHSRSDSYEVKFTHGDLCPNNILVDNGRITAIIDWEFAGWFPEYWEYTKMHYGWRPYRKEIYDALDQTLTPYPEELAAESAIWKVFDTFEYDVPLTRSDAVESTFEGRH